MGSRAGTALVVALGLWTGAAVAGETIWEGEVRVVDAKTLAGVPDGPELTLGGIEPPAAGRPMRAGGGEARVQGACRAGVAGRGGRT